MTFLIAFTAALVLLACAGFYLSAQVISAGKAKYLFVAVPLLLTAAASTYFTIDGVMGWPTTRIPEKLEMLSYRSNGKKLWIWGIEKGSRIPRTFVIPYNEKAQQELHKGTEAIKNGGRAELRGKSDSHGDSKAPFEFHSFTPLEDLPAKDPK